MGPVRMNGCWRPRRLLAALLLVPALWLPESRAEAAPPRRSTLVVPFEIGPETSDTAWLAPAVTESIKYILQRFGFETPAEARPGAAPPPGFEKLTGRQVLEWLGKDQSGKIDFLVFGRGKIGGDQITIHLYPYEVKKERQAKEYKLGGNAVRLGSLITKLADNLVEFTGARVPKDLREEVFKGMSPSNEVLSLYGISFRTDDIQEKLRFLRTASEAGEKFPPALMQLGLTLYAAGEKDEAREAFKRVVEASPRYKEAFNNLGVILGEGKQIQEAEKVFRSALKLDDDYVDARFNLAKLLDQARRDEEAVREYEKLVKAVPDRLEFRFLMALALDRVGKPEKALDEFRWLSPKDSSMAEYFFLRKGKEARQEKRFQDAESFFKRALEINGKLWEVYREQGINSFMMGDYDRGLGYFRTAAEKMPGEAEIWHYQGMAANKLGRKDEALAAFRKAVDLGGVKEASLELGRLYAESGRWAEAVSSLNRYLKEDPSSEEGKNLLAEATRRAKEETEAMQQKAEFASRRLDKMEGIVGDLNRRNSELEIKLGLATEQAAKSEAEAGRLRAEKTAQEADFAKRSQEANDSLRSLNQQLAELREIQGEKLAALERDLARESKARKEAEDNLNHMVAKLKEEGRLTINTGLTEEEAKATRQRAETMKASIVELEASVEKGRRELAEAVKREEVLREGHQRELLEVAATRKLVDAELSNLKADYQKRLLEGELAVKRIQEEAARDLRLLAKAESEAGAARERIKLLETEKKDLEAALSASKEQAREKEESLASRIGKLEKELAESGELAADLRSGNASLTADLASSAGAMEKERRGAALQADGLAKSLAESERKLKLAAEDNEDLRRRLARLEKDTAELDKTWQSKYQALVQARKSVGEEIDAIKQATQSKVKELETLLDEERKERKEAQKKSGQLDRAREECAELRQEAEAGLKGLGEDLAALRSEREARARELDRLSRDMRKLREDFIEGMWDLAEGYRRQGAGEKAERVYLLVLKHLPEEGRTYRRLGEVYREMKQEDKARQMFQKASQLMNEESP